MSISISNFNKFAIKGTKAGLVFELGIVYKFVFGRL